LIPVSGCVIALNEEDRMERCLTSLDFCSELLVLDSGSSDRTVAIARHLGARVEHQDFLGHRRQKQRAVELATHDWIVSLDCDETAPPELAHALAQHLAEEPHDVVGFRVARRNVYLGRAMRHGLFWPDRKLRVFDRRRARWGGTDPHDRVESTGAGRVVDLDVELLHDSYRSFAEHRATLDRFATIAARSMAAEGRRVGPLAPVAHASSALFKGALLKLGILDGWRGAVAAWMSACYDYRKYKRLRAMQS